MSRFRVSLLRPDGGLALLGLAVVVYLGGFEILHHGFYAHDVISDTVLYQKYGTEMREGRVPYRDFAIEYPPGALPVFLAPTYISQNYRDAFWWLMAGLGVCGLVCLKLCRPPRIALAVVAVSPLLIGSYLPTRFDLWPTAFVVAAFAALLHDRHRLGWAALGAGVAAKLFPLFLMPIAAVWTFRRRGPLVLAQGLGVAACVLAAAFAPFLAVAPRGIAQSLWGQFSRPLQIESLAASVLMTFGHPHVIVSHGSLNLSGHGAIGASSAIASAVAMAAIWVAFARGPAEPDRLVRFAAACLVAFVAFGKVLSPQFLIWLVPVVPMLRGRRGLAATGLLVAALIDTQVWFPERYFAYVYHAHLAWLVLLRDLMLVALFFVLSLPQRGPLRRRSHARLPRIRRELLRFGHPPRQPRAGPGTP